MRNLDFAQQRGRSCCSPGDPVKTIFSPYVNDDGTITLVATGEVNTDDEIESYRQSCDIHTVLERFMAGDTSVLMRTQGQYLDLTQFPTTYAEVIQRTLAAESLFDKLPEVVRQKYGFDWRQWLAQTGTTSWFADLGIVEKKDDEEEGDDK